MKKCKFCGSNTELFVDLGHAPPSGSFLTKEQLDQPEVYYPLRVYVCTTCWLVQSPEHKKASEIFAEDYVYYSSQSPANVSHAKKYCEMMCKRFLFPAPYPEKIYKRPNVLEIGSNDGYMLQWFKEVGCNVHGVDPASGPAAVAMEKGIPTSTAFFGKQFANEHKWGIYNTNPVNIYDLICGINVLNHQPDINDFVAGLKIALAPEGIITFEFPHLMNLIDECQFDQMYHEHYEYYSFMAIFDIFRRHGLEIFDVDKIPEHGGSLRIYAEHGDSKPYPCSDRISAMFHEEYAKGMNHINYYVGFQNRINNIKNDLLDFLIGASCWQICAYSAPHKGNTLLNYCGIKPDLLPFVVDISPHKQGRFLPGSHIPIYDEHYMKKLQPDYVLVLAWNLKHEIMEQLKYIREWNGKFVVAIPELEVL